MSRYKPNQWLPPESLPDIRCTIPQLWSRYYPRIAALCHLSDSTVQEYTTQLGIIHEAISRRPAPIMTCYDIWEAVRTVRSYVLKGAVVLYRNSVYVKRMAAIHDIYIYCESACICCDVLDIPPWRLLFPEGAPDYTIDVDEMADRLQKLAAKRSKCRYLTLAQERRLVRQIVEHIRTPDPEAGLWLGLAVLLYTGLRGNELRALRFGSFRTFRAADRQGWRYIDVYQTVTEAGIAQASMKTSNAVRRLPEPLELHQIMACAEEQRRALTGKADISDLPVVCGRDPVKPCTAVELIIFAKRVLTSIVDTDTRDGMALACYIAEDTEDGCDPADMTGIADYSADRSMTARVLRRNVATKLYAETTLTDVGIRLWMGHQQDIGVRVHGAYGEDEVWETLQAVDHRMIAPELHPGWCVDLTEGTVELAQVGKQFLRIPRNVLLQGAVITIELEALEQGDAIKAELRRLLPKGASIEIETSHHLAPKPMGRLNTDHSHWMLSQWPRELTDDDK